MKPLTCGPGRWQLAAISVLVCALGLAGRADAGACNSQRFARLADPPVATGAVVAKDYGRLPLSFEPNQGQTDPRVKFLSHGRGYVLLLTSTEALLSLRAGAERREDLRPSGRGPLPFSAEKNSENVVLRVRLKGANRTPQMAAIDELPGKVSYFIGDDPRKWRINIPNYAAVRYQEVYPGVDLVYRGESKQQLEYRFELAPAARPEEIELEFGGAKGVSINRQGELVVRLGGGELIEHAPVIYQEIGGRRREVAGGYAMRAGERVGFRVAAYDRTTRLVIDPTLVYSTFLGGSLNNVGLGIAVDSSGSAYVTGQTESTDFPVTLGAFHRTLKSAGGNAFVSKLTPSGTSLAYSTYLGGSGAMGDEAIGIAVDSSGSAYVTGQTHSTDFPVTTGAFQRSLKSASGNAFVSKLTPTGTSLAYSTYLGGSSTIGSGDAGFGIAVDGSGSAYVTGVTMSRDFPIKGAFQTGLKASIGNAFVTKLTPTGMALVYSTYLGGTVQDFGTGIAVDASGSAYLAGATLSRDFPTHNPFQLSRPGAEHAFVTKLTRTGAALMYSTYLGGTSKDASNGIALDASGSAYVTGFTTSSDFPTTPGAFQISLKSSQNAFVTKLTPTGTAPMYSTYLGGSGQDAGNAIAVDCLGAIYLTGNTTSSDFPVTVDAFQTSLKGGGNDVFVTRLRPFVTAPSAAELSYSTYLGGSRDNEGAAIAVDSTGGAYVTGLTLSGDFPTTPGALQTTVGLQGAFVSKFVF